MRITVIIGGVRGVLYTLAKMSRLSTDTAFTHWPHRYSLYTLATQIQPLHSGHPDSAQIQSLHTDTAFTLWLSWLGTDTVFTHRYSLYTLAILAQHSYSLYTLAILAVFLALVMMMMKPFRPVFGYLEQSGDLKT